MSGTCILLDGRITDEAAFHTAMRVGTGVEWYGGNLDALFDLLVGATTGPVAIRWVDAGVSRRAIGPRFDRLVTVMLDAAAQRPGVSLELRS